MNFEKLLAGFIDNLEDETIVDAAEDLKSRFVSPEARASAIKINQLFAQHKMLDSDGNLLQITDPAEIAGAVTVDGDQIKVELTEEQSKFLKADLLYGLRAIGLKYHDR